MSLHSFRAARLLAGLALVSASACSGRGDDAKSLSQAQVRGAERIKDIRTTSTNSPSGSTPSHFTKLGQKTFFLAETTRAEKREVGLYATDGTDSGTSRVFDLGVEDYALPRTLVEHQGKLYTLGHFQGDKPAVFESDGTPAGTRALGTFDPDTRLGPLFSTPHGLLFSARLARLPGQPESMRLYTIDLATGTRQVLLDSPSLGFYPSRYGFAVSTASHTLVSVGYGDSILTDGTQAGTRTIQGIERAQHAALLGPSHFVVSGYDGTTGGSWVRILDTGTGTVSALPALESQGAARPLSVQGLTAVGNRVLIGGTFRGEDGTYAGEIWVTDGSAASTQRLTSVPVDNTGDIQWFAAQASGSTYVGFGATSLFGTTAGNSLFPMTTFPELPSSDARLDALTSDGQRLVAQLSYDQTVHRAFEILDPIARTVTTIDADSYKPVRPKAAPGNDAPLVTADGLFFGCRSTRDGATFAEDPCVADASGIRLVSAPDQHGPSASDPEHVVVAGNRAYFYADDGVHGRELWVTNGTEAGTRMVKDLTPGPDSSRFSSILTAVPPLVVGNTYFFQTRDASYRTEHIWRTDGTEAGTFVVADLTDPELDSSGRAARPIVAGNYLYYMLPFDDHRLELHRTDGTPAGDKRLAELRPADPDGSWPSRYDAVDMRAIGDHVIAIVATDSTSGERRAVLTDGKGARDLGAVGRFVDADDRYAYFELDRGAGHPSVLQRVDVETESITRFSITKKRGDDPNKLLELGTCAGVTGGKLVFYSDGPVSEIWTTDGTDAGTIQLGTTKAGNRRYCGTGSFPTSIYRADNWGSRVVITTGGTILLSDGTPDGTQEVLGESFPRILGISDGNGVLYRSGSDLYAWDGGTPEKLVEGVSFASESFALAPGGAVAVTRTATAGASRLVWIDFATGQTIDVTGTAQEPRTLRSVGRHVVFSAEDGSGDRELWGISLSTP